jgi:hypothetical protein
LAGRKSEVKKSEELSDRISKSSDRIANVRPEGNALKRIKMTMKKSNNKKPSESESKPFFKAAK